MRVYYIHNIIWYVNDKQATFHVKRRKSNVEKNKTIQNPIYNLQPSCAMVDLL